MLERPKWVKRERITRRFVCSLCMIASIIAAIRIHCVWLCVCVCRFTIANKKNKIRANAVAVSMKYILEDEKQIPKRTNNIEGFQDNSFTSDHFSENKIRKDFLLSRIYQEMGKNGRTRLWTTQRFMLFVLQLIIIIQS